MRLKAHPFLILCFAKCDVLAMTDIEQARFAHLARQSLIIITSLL